MRKPILLGLLLTLSACGFHLRGSFDVPDKLRSVYLSSENPQSQLLLQLRSAMRASGVDVVEKAEDAAYTLYLSNEHSERRSISIDSIAATAEFQIRQAVEYELQDSNKRTVVGPFQINNERNFQNDINNIVGKRDEEALINEEMRVQLAGQIMRRYQSIDTSALNASSHTESSGGTTP